MTHSITFWAMQFADWVFGWILYLPRDVSLFSVAILSSVLLTLVRRWTTDQEWLRRVVIDTARQKQLRREASRRGDKDAARRHQDLITRIKMKSLRREVRPLLWALIPVTLLATWSFERLAFLPPRLDQPVEIRACVPHAAIGQLAHLAPEPGLGVTEDGWIQQVVEDRRALSSNAWDTAGRWIGSGWRGLLRRPDFSSSAAAVPDGAAIWHVVVRDTRPQRLKIRYAGRTYEAPFRAGTRRYDEPITVFPGAPLQTIEVALIPRRLFDLVGGMDRLFLPPWLVAYFLIAIPAVSILKRVLRIY